MRIGYVFIAASLLTACHKEKPKPVVVVPQAFHVKFETSKGDFVVEARRAWAPHGVDRFYELLRMKYFDQGRFFRVVPGFIAQFGVNRDFNVHAKWREYFIVDDPARMKNLRGTLSYAMSGPDTRATEMFINLADNSALDQQGFAPFARVTQGMDVVDKLYSGYGEVRPVGKYIDPGRVEGETNEYLVQDFPRLDYIVKTEILP
ncbi:MAG TPA: peptidylprolyl isomerase [Bryobacteraceae bacterium]|nr:peptidylprolyl isomerase [Bryobacteraceae bacterium]